MNSVAARVGAKPFFLKSDSGQRFCLLYPPCGDFCKGAFLYVHPFGEEMNKSRRMAALQAREFAANGYAVLQMDLLGCGDSSGEFGDASWNAWKEDLALAQQWLIQEYAVPFYLWGLRLGGLLALDYAQNAHVDRLLLWQPILSGNAFMTQFLRLRVANEMLADGKEKSGGGTQALRDALKMGETLEIAGYDITSQMAEAIDTLDASKLIPTCPISWFEIVAAEGKAMTPASMRIVNAWQQQGVELTTHTVACLQFWATQEISECPELLTQTTAILPTLSSRTQAVSHAI
jgi:exosortase A-associated hydrolase 2